MVLNQGAQVQGVLTSWWTEYTGTWKRAPTLRHVSIFSCWLLETLVSAFWKQTRWDLWGKPNYGDGIDPEDWAVSRFICSRNSLTVTYWHAKCSYAPWALPATSLLPLYFQPENPVAINLTSLILMSQLVPVCLPAMEEKVVSVWQCNYCHSGHPSPLWLLQDTKLEGEKYICFRIKGAAGRYSKDMTLWDIQRTKYNMLTWWV